MMPEKGWSGRGKRSMLEDEEEVQKLTILDVDCRGHRVHVLFAGHQLDPGQQTVHQHGAGVILPGQTCTEEEETVTLAIFLDLRLLDHH